MPYDFDLPQSFDPLEFMAEPRLAMRADDARWLVSTIVRKMASGDVDHLGWARLHSDILRRVMNQRTYHEVIEALLGGGVERDAYEIGAMSFGYRLAKRYLGDNIRRVPATDPRLIARIEREQRRIANEQAARCRPIHDALAAMQDHLTITPEADDILRWLPDESRLSQSTLVNDIRTHHLRFTVGSTGRVFNAITGLKRELRRSLRLGGEPVAGIDIRASQPSLLAMLLYQWYFPTKGVNGALTYCRPPSLPLPPCRLTCSGACPPADVVGFAACARDGRIYESLASLAGLTREEAKHRFLVDVLAKRGRYPSDLEDAFGAEFPTVYAVVRQVNCEDHCTLIRLLQAIEAWLVIDMVCPRLIDREVPCLTLHDSVWSQVRTLDRVEAAFGEVFAEIGFPLSLKREIPGSDARLAGAGGEDLRRGAGAAAGCLAS